MELGNLCFGNSRGEFSIKDRTTFEKIFYCLELYLGDQFSHREFSNDVFKIFPYYWGDCACGYDDRERKWDEDNNHSSECYQYDLCWLRQEYSSILNIPDKKIKDLCKKHNIPYDSGKGSAVHCTCDYRDKWWRFIADNYHDAECPIIKPNFVYKPENITIDWYKYPMRDSYSNVDLTPEKFKKIIKECIKSLRKKE